MVIVLQNRKTLIIFRKLFSHQLQISQQIAAGEFQFKHIESRRIHHLIRIVGIAVHLVFINPPKLLVTSRLNTKVKNE